MTELNSNTADTAVICEWPSNLAAQDWETGATEADAAEIGGEKKSAIICGKVMKKEEDDGKENIFSQMHMTESCVTAKCSDKTPILSERSANVTTGGKSQRSRSDDGKDDDKLKKRSKKKCSYEGCDKYVQKGGVCWGHRANRLNPGKQVSTAASLLINLSRNV